MRNWNKLYKTYVERYNKKVATSPVGMDEVYSLSEFMSVYTAMETDRMAEIRAGKRKVANITQDIVARQQAYDLSMKQAKVVQKRMEELYGEKISIRQIRLGKTGEFWDDVRQVQQELKSQGIVGKENAKIIASTFFGSP